jgi:rhomboid protease GluP
MTLTIRDEIERLENPEAADEQARVQAFATRLGVVTPWVTYGLALVLSIVYVLQELWGGSTSILVLVRMGALVRSVPPTREPWRLLSHSFLHIGFLHLLFNIMALLVLGAFLERLLGSRRFLLLYGLSTLGGGLAIATFGNADVTAGASGALWGLMLAEATLVVRPGKLVPDRVLENMKAKVWQPVMLNLANSMRPGVSLAGHLGGGLAGAMVMLSGAVTAGLSPSETPALPDERGRGEDTASGPWWVTACSAAAGLLMAASLAAQLVEGRPWEIGQPPELRRLALTGTSLSLEVPRGLAVQPVVPEGEFQTFTLGKLDRDPMVVFATIGPVQGIGPKELLESLPAMTKYWDKLKAEGFVIETPPQIHSVGGRSVVFVQFKHQNGARVRAYMSIVGKRFTRLDVVSNPFAPKAWEQVPERVAASLREEGGGLEMTKPR